MAEPGPTGPQRPILVIGNKLYSSWSMRPWLLLRGLGIAFDEVLLPMRTDIFAAELPRYSPAGKVPVLVDGDVAVWDSLAIAEYAAERWPEAGVWPASRHARATARAVSAEMHSGFTALRAACPMNLGKRFAPADRGEKVAADVARILGIFRDARARFGGGGPFLFGAFSAADAMFAPVLTRFETYAIPLDPVSAAYSEAVLGLPAYRDWLEAALAEPWTMPGNEGENPVRDLRAAPAGP